MKIRPRHHGPTDRHWVSIGMTVREARALADCLSRAMLVDARDPDGLDTFAHSTMHDLDRALERIQAGATPTEAPKGV